MENTSKTVVTKNLIEKSIIVTKTFHTDIKKVWQAYTDSSILDQWWAPLPWKAKTKTMHFNVGGYWLYVMQGPENEKHWERMEYTAIKPHVNFEIKDVFCDENGVPNTALPASTGSIAFHETKGSTTVEFNMFYTTEKEITTIIEMGFELGITACLEQLEHLLLTKDL